MEQFSIQHKFNLYLNITSIKVIIIYMHMMCSDLKGTVLQDLLSYFWQTTLPGLHMIRLKRYLRKPCVRKVVDYADLVWAYSLTMLTWCVGILIDYADLVCGHTH